jgi:hypothetical protein
MRSRRVKGVASGRLLLLCGSARAAAGRLLLLCGSARAARRSL